MMNLTVFDYDMERYKNQTDLKNFYQCRGIDGLELQLLWDKALPDKIIQKDIVGVHTRMYPYWIDLWMDNWPKLIQEFDSVENVETYYQGKTKDVIINRLSGELDRAQALGVSYVVFHVSDCRFSEVWGKTSENRDKDVIDQACKLINELLSNKHYTFDFLVENLWWAGFTMTNPQLTERLLAGIKTEKKGIMFDTGHLLHTNTALRTQRESIEYIEKILEKHGDLCQWIKGVHLNQSLTGTYVKQTVKHPPGLKKDFWKRFEQCMLHIFAIDQHLPFTEAGICQILETIDPEYLTLEMMSKTREELALKLDEQITAIHSLFM